MGEFGGVCARLGTLAVTSGLTEPSLRSMLGILCRESRSAKRATSSLVPGEDSSLDSVGTRDSGDCAASSEIFNMCQSKEKNAKQLYYHSLKLSHKLK